MQSLSQFVHPSSPKIISVHSFRSGTGKSNIASNLAVTLAQQGTRVGLVDMDMQSPGIHALFGIETDQLKYTLNDYLCQSCAVEEIAYNVSAILQHPCNALPHVPVNSQIYLIPARLQSAAILRLVREGYSISRLIETFQQLIRRLKLDYLLVDTHPGLNQETLLSISIADVLIIILRPDYHDFQGTAITVEVARKLTVPRQLLVVNQALLDVDPNLRQQVEAAYQTTVAGVLPLCHEMIRLASSDIFCLCHPEHALSQELQTIAQQIMN